MPVFQNEQYELHCQTYSVDANSEAEAIRKLLDGEAEPLDGMLEFIEVARTVAFGCHHSENLAISFEREMSQSVTGSCRPSGPSGKQ